MPVRNMIDYGRRYKRVQAPTVPYEKTKGPLLRDSPLFKIQQDNMYVKQQESNNVMQGNGLTDLVNQIKRLRVKDPANKFKKVRSKEDKIIF